MSAHIRKFLSHQSETPTEIFITRSGLAIETSVRCVEKNSTSVKNMRIPLHALHIFCIVVSQGGIRQAAQALHLTPGAVSRQIQALEEYLGQTLFNRGSGSAAALTPAGYKLHEQVSDKMNAIVDVLSVHGTSSRQKTVLVDTNVTLAMHWLIPHLRTFHAREPDILVQVRTVEGDIDPVAPVDVFIRREESEFRTLPRCRFMTEYSLLLASPEYISTIPTVDFEDTAAQARLSRIGTRSRPDLWAKWAEHIGLEPNLLEPTLEFDNTVLAIQACAQGLGVMVVPELFVASMLSSGVLNRISPERAATGKYSFAVGRQRESLRVRAFTAWLEEAGAMASDNSTSTAVSSSTYNTIKGRSPQ